MTTSSRIERVCGLLTGVFAIIATLLVVNVNLTSQILDFLLLYILPAWLVAVGSWIHSGTQRKSGFLILLVGGLVLVLELVPGFLGTFYFHGLLVGLLTLTPGVMAAITIVAAWVSRNSSNSH